MNRGDFVPSVMSGASQETVSDLISNPDEKIAVAIFDQGKEAVVFALLQLAKELAESKSPDNPATPSGMIPVYKKPPSKKRKRKPGSKTTTRAAAAPSPHASTAMNPSRRGLPRLWWQSQSVQRNACPVHRRHS